MNLIGLNTHSVRAVIVIVAYATAGFLSSSARAALITYETPAGATTGGQPVDAEVSFVTSANTVQITLKSDQPDPVSAVQCLSGLRFHLSTGQTSGSLTSSAGMDRSIFSDGTYTDGAVVPTGWFLETVSSDLRVNDLGGDAPTHTIVGPPDGSNLYASGNSSITNGSHNPHIGLSATFTLNVPGVTASSTISSVVFQFNTSSGNNVTGTVKVPEPASAGILAIGCFGLLRRRKN